MGDSSLEGKNVSTSPASAPTPETESDSKITPKNCQKVKLPKDGLESQKTEPPSASTMKEEYRNPTTYNQAQLRDIPKRRLLFRNKVIEEMMAEIEKEKLVKDPIEDYCTTYEDMFRIPGFKNPDQPVMNEELHLKYPLYSSQPITYWTDKIDKHLKDSARIGGMTKIRDLKTPFRKNGEFTTPVHLRLDSPEC